MNKLFEFFASVDCYLSYNGIDYDGFIFSMLTGIILFSW